MEQYQVLIGMLAGSGTIGVVLLAIWKAVRKPVFEALEAWALKLKDERLRVVLVALVRAAEQLYGEQPAEDLEKAAALGARKMSYVMETARVKGLKATQADVEAAVHEVKKNGAAVIAKKLKEQAK